MHQQFTPHVHFIWKNHLSLLVQTREKKSEMLRKKGMRKFFGRLGRPAGRQAGKKKKKKSVRSEDSNQQEKKILKKFIFAQIEVKNLLLIDKSGAPHS